MEIRPYKTKGDILYYKGILLGQNLIFTDKDGNEIDCKILECHTIFERYLTEYKVQRLWST